MRPPDWVNHIRFYIVPIGSSAISRYLSAVDATYGAMFGTDGWQQLCERAIGPDPAQSKIDVVEVTNRVQRYLHSAGPCTQIPIAEAMVNYKEEDSCQIFVPFVSVSTFFPYFISIQNGGRFFGFREIILMFLLIELFDLGE